MKMIRKVFNSIVKDINVADKTLVALVSTGGVDRMGDVLEPKGADLKHYKKNPIVMWAHDYESPPIAKALWTKKTEAGVLSKMKFANTEFANEIFELYKDGFMNAFSVGFIPVDSEPMEKDSDSVWGAKRFLKWELLEYSAVPVPANPEALALAVSKGIITEEKKHTLEEMRKMSEGDPDKEEGDDQDDEEEELEDEEEGGADGVPKATPSDQDQEGQKHGGLEDVLGEMKLLEEKIVHLEKKNADLIYKLYLASCVKIEHKSEITVEDLSNKFAEIVDGVVRQAQGKVD